MAALLGIVANALFLDAYGSGWLPATYIAIGAAGIVVSGAVARTAQRFDLLGIAVSVLGSAAVALGVAWLIARDGGAAWVSVPLLVLFPILVQLGFVFIGGQAGRLLDIAGIKAELPEDRGRLPGRRRDRRDRGRPAGHRVRPNGGPAARDGARPGGICRARAGDGPPVRGGSPLDRARGPSGPAHRRARWPGPNVAAGAALEPVRRPDPRLPGPLGTRAASSPTSWSSIGRPRSSRTLRISPGSSPATRRP